MASLFVTKKTSFVRLTPGLSFDVGPFDVFDVSRQVESDGEAAVVELEVFADLQRGLGFDIIDAGSGIEVDILKYEKLSYTCIRY